MSEFPPDRIFKSGIAVSDKNNLGQTEGVPVASWSDSSVGKDYVSPQRYALEQIGVNKNGLSREDIIEYTPCGVKCLFDMILYGWIEESPEKKYVITPKGIDLLERHEKKRMLDDPTSRYIW